MTLIEGLRTFCIAAVTLMAAVGSIFVFAEACTSGGWPQWLARVVNFVVIVGLVMFAGMLLSEPAADHKKCAQYVWLNEDWKCVPWEEAG